MLWGAYGLIVLVIEKVGEIHEGSGAILLPSVEKGIEIALRTDEKWAELPKECRVIAYCQFSDRKSQIETRKSKLENVLVWLGKCFLQLL